MCSKGIRVVSPLLVTPEDIIHLLHWERQEMGKNPSEGPWCSTTSSLLRRFLLPVCQLAGWGRLPPLPRNLCLRSFKAAPGSDLVPGSCESAFVRCSGWDCFREESEEFSPLGQKLLRLTWFCFFLPFQNYISYIETVIDFKNYLSWGLFCIDWQRFKTHVFFTSRRSL